MNDISDRFIDLAIDDQHESDYGQELIEKQEKFKREIAKQEFQFDSHYLAMPNSTSTADSDGADDLLDHEDKSLNEKFDSMAKHISDCKEIMVGQV